MRTIQALLYRCSCVYSTIRANARRCVISESNPNRLTTCLLTSACSDGRACFCFRESQSDFLLSVFKNRIGRNCTANHPAPIRLFPDLFASNVTQTYSVTFEIAQPRALSPLSLISIAFTCKFRSLSADQRKPKRLVGRASEGFGC